MIDINNLNEVQLDAYNEFRNKSDYLTMVNSKGGEMLKKAIEKDITNVVSAFTSEKTLEEYIRLSAKLNILFSLYKTFSSAETVADLAKEALTSTLAG